jgi:shikimate dehydrogenase
LSDKYAVLGNPIAHSKSPQIHAAFAKQTGQNISYEAILAPFEGFAITVEQLMLAGYKGVNVTVPFKFEAFEMCSELSPRALHAGAVNTMQYLPQRGCWFGDNTDGAGLVRDITQNLGTALKGARVLLLGAGGAAQGVLLPILEQSPASVVVANRTIEKAERMVSKLVGFTHLSQASTFGGLQGQFDIIINATSTGLTDTALPIADSIFAKNCLAYDMMYGRETPFMAQARANGAQVADGLGMLVEQAAEAFYIWRGVRPETAPVIQLLRSAN